MNRREYIVASSSFLGYTMTFGAIASLMQSCKTESKEKSASHTGSVLDESQYKLLASLTDTILPKTDTPGALDARCPEFIVKLLSEVYSEEDKQEFIEGLNQLGQDYESKHKMTFVKSEISKREAYLNELDQTSPKFPPSMWGIVLTKSPQPVGFFRKLKAATLMAYYTSEEMSK